MTHNPATRGVVLVVDSDDDTRELYAEWLAFEGHRVLETRDAESALALAAKHHPSVIVTEVRLQPFDGLELLSRLKTTPVVQAIPVVVATSQTDARTLTGHARAELVGSTVWDFTPADDLADGRATWQRFLEAGEFDGFYRLRRKDGTLVWVRCVALAHVVSGLHVSAFAEVSDSTIVAA